MSPAPETPPWPNVPACYGWLSLDCRGGWRLKGEVVRHGGLMSFLNSNYGPDGDGSWRVLNGPQKVYVSLEYTPWVWRLDAGTLLAHTGQAAGAPDGIWLDDEGHLLLHTPLGIGLLDDRDLSALMQACVDERGAPAEDAQWLAVMEGRSVVWWLGLPVQAVARAAVATRFGFQDQPGQEG